MLIALGCGTDETSRSSASPHTSQQPDATVDLDRDATADFDAVREDRPDVERELADSVERELADSVERELAESVERELADSVDAPGPDAALSAPETPDELWVVEVQSPAGSKDVTRSVRIVRLKLPEGTELLPAIDMPKVPSGRDLPFTLGGDRASAFAGRPTRSLDGRFVTLAGYGVGPGRWSPEDDRDRTIPRVVAKIDAARKVETATTIAAFARHEVVGTLTADGTRHYTYGSLGILHHRDGADEIGTLVYEGRINALQFTGGSFLASVAPARPWNLGSTLPVSQVWPTLGAAIDRTSCLGDIFLYARRGPSIDTAYVATCSAQIMRFRVAADGTLTFVKHLRQYRGSTLNSMVSRLERGRVVFYVSDPHEVYRVVDDDRDDDIEVMREQIHRRSGDGWFRGLAFAPR
jgi:hypothetical protein